jgi:hypothetical protein
VSENPTGLMVTVWSTKVWWKPWTWRRKPGVCISCDRCDQFNFGADR